MQPVELFTRLIKSKIISGRKTFQVQVRDGHLAEIEEVVNMISTGWYGHLFGEVKQDGALKRVHERLDMVVKKTMKDRAFLRDLRSVSLGMELQGIFFKVRLRDMLVASEKEHWLDLSKWKPTELRRSKSDELKPGEEQTLYVLWLMKVLVLRNKARNADLSVQQAAEVLFQFLDELRALGKQPKYWKPTNEGSPASIGRNIDTHKKSAAVRHWSDAHDLPIERVLKSRK